MKKLLYIILILVGTNLMAQDTNKRKIHHKFTTINNFMEFDKYGTFETDDGIKLKVDKDWFDIFVRYQSPEREDRVEFIFYNDENEFLSFGVIYDELITFVSPPDKKGDVVVHTLLCPTMFKLNKNHPNFDKLHKLLIELKENEDKALIGAGQGTYFEIVDIKKLLK